MSTPTTFFLPDPIDNSSYPTCRPPKLLKHQIYENENIFEKIDSNAIRVAKNVYPSFRDLLWDLVFSLKLNEVEKARVIFRWMTLCDLNKLNFPTYKKGGPEEKLVAFKKFKTSYASTFELLCSYAGIFCLTLKGYAKGIDYRPGDRFSGRPFNHSWNAIFIDDSWQLIDTLWAARYICTGKTNQNVVVFQYDDFYFLMEPQQAVYSHFPQDNIWQLLKVPVSLNQFECLPYIKSQFFKCYVDFQNQYHGVVHSKEGYLKMTLGFWRPDSFIYKLVTEDNSSVYKGVPLKYFVIQETVNNQINFYFRFPAAGVYFLTVFVKEIDESNETVNHEHIYRAACEYKIVADVASKIPLPFPMTCHDFNWGLQPSLVSYYNLVSSQENGVISISSPDNKPYIRTEITFDKMREDVEILCKLRKNGLHDEDILDQYVEVDEKSHQTIFILNLPEPDEYALEIYANDPSEEETFTLIGQYMLDFNAPPGFRPQSSVFGPITADSMILLRDTPSNIREMYDYETNAEPIGILPRPYVQYNYVPDDITLNTGESYEQPQLFATIERKQSSESDLEIPDFLPPLPPPPPIPSIDESTNSVLTGDAYTVNENNLTKKIVYPSNQLSHDVVIKHSGGETHPVVGLIDPNGVRDQRMIPGDKISPSQISDENSLLIRGNASLSKPFLDDNYSKLVMGDSVQQSSLKSVNKNSPEENMWISDTESIQQSDKLQPYLASVERGLSPQLSRHVYSPGVQSKSAESMFRFSKFDVTSNDIPKSQSSTNIDLKQGQSYNSSKLPDSKYSNLNDSSINEVLQKPVVFRGYGRPNLISEPGDTVRGNNNVTQLPSSDIKNSTIGSLISEPIMKSNDAKEETSNILGPTHFSGVYGARKVSQSNESKSNTGFKSGNSSTQGVSNLKDFFETRNADSLNQSASKESLLTRTSAPGYGNKSFGRVPVKYDKSSMNKSFGENVLDKDVVSREDVYGVPYPSNSDKMSIKNDSGGNKINQDLLAGSHLSNTYGDKSSMIAMTQEKSSFGNVPGNINLQGTSGIHGAQQSSVDPNLVRYDTHRQDSGKVTDPAYRSSSYEVPYSSISDKMSIKTDVEGNKHNQETFLESSAGLHLSNPHGDKSGLINVTQENSPYGNLSGNIYPQGTSGIYGAQQSPVDPNLMRYNTYRQDSGKVTDPAYMSRSHEVPYSWKSEQMSIKTNSDGIKLNEEELLGISTGLHLSNPYGDKTSLTHETQENSPYGNLSGSIYQQGTFGFRGAQQSSVDPNLVRHYTHRQDSGKVTDPEHMSRSHEALNYARIDNTQSLPRSFANKQEWSNNSDPGNLFTSVGSKTLDRHKITSGSELPRGNTDHNEEWSNKFSPGHLSGVPGVYVHVRPENYSEKKSIQRSSEHLEESSKKFDPKYISRPLKDNPQQRGSIEHLEDSLNKFEPRYVSRPLESSNLEPYVVQIPVRQGNSSSERLEESSSQLDPRYIHRTLRDKSSDNQELRRNSEYKDGELYKSDPGYLLGSYSDQTSERTDRVRQRSSEHLEDWFNRSDSQSLPKPRGVQIPVHYENPSINRGLQGNRDQREQWSNRSDPGYISSSQKVLYPGEFNDSLQASSLPKDKSLLSSYTSYLPGPYGSYEETMRSTSTTVEISSRAVRGYPNQVDPEGDSNKISNLSTRLTPLSLKRPKYIDVTYDQYNNQYEDSSRIMPSPMQTYKPEESTANWTSGPIQKEPPKNFQPTPIDVEEEIYIPEIQALPSEIPNCNIISPEETSKIFQRIDDHAIQISTQHQDSFNQLIWQLIYARNITDELEKVRVIFLWLCTKDLHKMNFDDIKKDSPEEILMGLKSGKSTYAQIFLILCRYAGLHCKLISGYAKGADYVPGMKFEGRLGEHSWNSVLLNGIWRLIDCHWAARRLIGKERKPENVRYELDMFYFLVNPSQLIYTHFPHETDWQLLHHPITLEEFELLAPVKSMFFKYNLELITHKNAVINCHAPEFELKIAFPKGVEEQLLFTFTLTLNDGKEDYNGISLLRFGRHEIDFVNYHSCFWIRAPAPGSYKLLIYSKSTCREQSVSDFKSQTLFGAICEYKIEFVFPSRLVLQPFPSCQTTNYGPTEVFKNYPIEASIKKSSIFTENGMAEIKFIILKPEIRMMAKLISNSGMNSDKLTEQCIIQRLVDSREVLINVYLPEPGEYGLEIYSNDSSKDGNSFYTVWQYFLVTNKASIVKGLPNLPPGYMGPFEPKFTNYGLSVSSHKDPFIVSNSGDLSIQMKVSEDKPIRVMTQLIHCTNNQTEICSNQVLQQVRDSTFYFLVRFPNKGFFKLQIYALPYSESNENLPGVYNYLILANQSSSHLVPYPQQFAQWKEGCYLYEPVNGTFGAEAKLVDYVTFRMDVPRAFAVAVVVNNEWSRLEKEPQGTWSGKVNMKLPWGKSEVDSLSVCANYGKSLDDSFTTILKYSIQ